jgi:hypothetical protein
MFVSHVVEGSLWCSAFLTEFLKNIVTASNTCLKGNENKSQYTYRDTLSICMPDFITLESVTAWKTHQNLIN